MLPAIILFAITYILMLTFSKYRPWIALGSAGVFLLSGMLPIDQIWQSIDLNVLLMIAGTMGLVALFSESKMPALLADLIMERVPNVQMAAVCLALFAGIISAFVDNVATVLMVAPVALAICKKLDTNPVPMLIGIAVSSNLQGAATLVGDTTAIMLGSALDRFPTVLLSGTIVLLILASFLPEKPAVTNGVICCGLLLVGAVYNCLKKGGREGFLSPLKAIDFETIGLLFGLFLIIGGISNMGVIDALAGLLANLGGGNVFTLYTVIVWASVLISAFIDNIPYVATMIPVIATLSARLGCDPTPLYFGLLSGATLGGNCTPIGASANITAIGILRKEGYEVKNADFFRIGVPFTIAAVLPAYLLIWFLFGV